MANLNEQLDEARGRVLDRMESGQRALHTVRIE